MEEQTSGKRIQLLTTFIINILAVATGASFGIVNVLISDLQSLAKNDSSAENNDTSPFDATIRKEDDFSFVIDVQESTWIATFGMIGQYFPILFVGPIVGRFGKRISMQLDCVIFMIGFLLMGLSVDVRMLYASKFLLGYAYLTSRSSIQPFTCEITDPSIRGFAASLWALHFTIGQASSIFTAGMLGWRQVSGFFAALMGVCFLALIWPHETPEWLMEKLRFNNAIKSYEFYKSDKTNIIEDSDNLISDDGTEKTYGELVEDSRKEKKLTTDSSSFKDSTKEDSKEHTSTISQTLLEKKNFISTTIKSPEFYKPFGFLIVTFGLLELSGFAVLANFSIVLMETYGYGSNTFVDASQLVTIISLTRIPVAIMSVPVLQKFNKRPTYLTVCAILLVIIAGIISFTTLVENGSLTKEQIQSSYLLQAIPFTLFILFYAGFSFGYGNIPFALMGELFPPSISNAANTAIFVIVNSVELTTVYTALLIKEKHGLQYVFVIPAFAILFSAIWAAIFMPETNGLSLKQIRMIYSSKSTPAEAKKETGTEKVNSTEGIEAYKSTHRKSCMTLWSTDVCVTAMRFCDGTQKNRNPLMEIFSTARSVVEVENKSRRPSVSVGNEKGISLHTAGDNTNKKTPMSNLGFEQENSMRDNDVNRSV